MISRSAADRALFGFFLLRFYRYYKQRQIASLFHGRLVGGAVAFASREESFEYRVPEIFVLDLPAFESDHDADFIAAGQEPVRVVQFRVEIVVADHYGKLDLLRFGALLFFARFLFFLYFVETEFAVVHYTAYRRRRLRRDEYKVEISFVSYLSCLFGRHDTDGLAVLVDQTDLVKIDLVIDQSVVFRCADILAPPDKI